jgi:hypothetical protein
MSTTTGGTTSTTAALCVASSAGGHASSAVALTEEGVAVTFASADAGDALNPNAVPVMTTAQNTLFAKRMTFSFAGTEVA